MVLVARPESKTWWRNFRSEADLELLVQGTWLPMTARAYVGADDPATVAPLLDAYSRRYPRAVKALGDGSPDDRVRGAVLVRCRPR